MSGRTEFIGAHVTEEVDEALRLACAKEKVSKSKKIFLVLCKEFKLDPKAAEDEE